MAQSAIVIYIRISRLLFLPFLKIELSVLGLILSPKIYDATNPVKEIKYPASWVKSVSKYVAVTPTVTHKNTTK